MVRIGRKGNKELKKKKKRKRKEEGKKKKHIGSVWIELIVAEN